MLTNYSLKGWDSSLGVGEIGNKCPIPVLGEGRKATLRI
jgi:hypothetical protein